MTALISVVAGRAAAFANWGAWKVACLRCPSADNVAPGDPGFQCVECGAVFEVVWPDPETRVGIERLLLMRPNVANQNWYPGETLLDLARENAAHGIFSIPDHLIEGEALTVTPDRILRDTLPLTRRRELRAIR